VAALGRAGNRSKVPLSAEYTAAPNNGPKDLELSYGYDKVGNVTSIADGHTTDGVLAGGLVSLEAVRRMSRR
jgi:hypothetical protein